MRSTENPQSPQPESASTLSITHILASALAAVTATFAASYFGVSGTIIGAALASVVTVVGNTLYSHSIRRTRERVRSVVPLTTLGMVSKAPDATMPDATMPDATMPDATTPDATTPDATTPDATPDATPAAKPPPRVAIPWRRVALGAAGLFVIVAAVVTGVEIAAGRPLTDVVHDQSGSGTSLFGGSQRSSTTPTTPAPSQPSTSSSSTAPTSITPSHPQSATTSTSNAPASSPTPTTPAPTATFPTPTTSPPPDGSPSPTPTG
jgi:hypothetical protein